MDLVDDYLSLTPDPHLLITMNSKCEVTGGYQFGAQDGFIDGRFEQDTENLRLVFSFEGSDEMDRSMALVRQALSLLTLYFCRCITTWAILIASNANANLRWIFYFL